MRRRDFIVAISGAAATWPRPVGAQQRMPTIGFLNASNRDAFREPLAAFLRGLADTGYVEGKNVAIEYRWAEDNYDRLPGLAADLVRRQVALIAAAGKCTTRACRQSRNPNNPDRF